MTAITAEREMEAVFGPEGALSRILPRFEGREPQVKMAACLWRAFGEGRIAVVEAGTGTGKSLAYLYPGFMHARPTGRPLVISTNTINLQEQLLTKDLPILARLCECPPKVVLLLGRANYLCRRRLELAGKGGWHELSAELLAALRAAAAAGRGERNGLDRAVPGDAWRAVCADAEFCLRQRCPWSSSCFWQTARRTAAEAEILLVNHHLLLADASVRLALGWEAERAVLPPYERVVFDEAHHLEDIATEHFSLRLSNLALGAALDRLQRREGPSHSGVLPLCQLGLSFTGRPPGRDKMAAIREWAAQAGHEVDRLRDKASALFSVLARLARRGERQDGGCRQWRYCEDLRGPAEELAPLAADLAVVHGSLDGLLGHILESWEGANAESPETEEGLALRAVRQALGKSAAALPLVLAGDSRDHVYWLETRRHGAQEEVAAVMAPLKAGPLFHQALLAQLHSAALVSATLTAGGDFAFIKERLGLDLVHPSTRLELTLASPFDYRRQVLLAATLDLPEPDAPGFTAAAAAFLAELMAATGGGMLVLFTSFTALAGIHGLLRANLPDGIRLFRQGEKPRAVLLQELQRGEGAVLLGTDSFWEGVDVPGLALSCVVLARLPFRVPTEPVVAARMEQVEREGGGSFYRYSLPQAIIKFKQGFGRLIRRGDDRGAVVILDRRVRERGYGREFLNALPPCAECFGAGREVVATVRAWMAGAGANPGSRAIEG